MLGLVGTPSNGTNAVTAQSSILPPNYGGSNTAPRYGTTPYPNYNPQQVQQNEPAAPNFGGSSGSMTPMEQQIANWLMSGAGGGSGSNSLLYQLFSPQEQAGRGLAQDTLQRQALNSQAGYIGQQSTANSAKYQLAGQQLAAQRNQAMQQSLIDRHSAQGQLAAQGAASSQMARDTLGNKADQGWYAANGNKNPSQPWVGNGQGTIQNALNYNLAGLYGQLQGAGIDYNLSQAGLYNQLAQLSPQYGQINQTDQNYNRLLSGNYNKNVTPEQDALRSALRQAMYGI